MIDFPIDKFILANQIFLVKPRNFTMADLL